MHLFTSQKCWNHNRPASNGEKKAMSRYPTFLLGMLAKTSLKTSNNCIANVYIGGKPFRSLLVRAKLEKMRSAETHGTKSSSTTFVRNF